MKLIITNNKQKYLTNLTTIERDKYLTYSELVELIYSKPTNYEILDTYEYEYKKVLLRNIAFVDQFHPLYPIKKELGIGENNLSFLSHYEIYSDILLDKQIEQKLPNITYLIEDVKLIDRDIYVFEDRQLECQYVVDEITKLLNNGVNINEINVIVPSEEYRYTLMLLLSMNDVSYYIDDAVNIINNKEVLQLLSLNSIEIMTQKVQDISDKVIRNKIIQIMSKNDNINDLKEEIKKAKVKYYASNNAVTITSSLEFDANNINIVCGVYANSYSLDYKDNDFFSDEVKKEIGLLTSKEKSHERHREFYNLINNAYLITKPEIDVNGETKNIFDFNEIRPVKTLSYSRNIEEYNIVNYHNLLTKFGEENERYELLKEKVKIEKPKDFRYLKYDLTFKPAISASSIEMYNKCNYSYYLRYVLKLKATKQNMWNLELGTFCHHMIEYGYLNSSSEEITDEAKRYVNETFRIVKDKLGNEISREKVFQGVEEQVVLNMIPFLIKLIEYTKSQFNSDCEIELEKKIEDDELQLVGYIDKYIQLGNEYVILDYKTGDAKMNFNFVHEGIEIQNLLYAYIINKQNSNLQLNGTFRQKAKPVVLKHTEKFRDVYNINGKLRNTSMVDLENVKIQVKKDGSVYSNKELTNVTDYYSLIEKNIKKVISNLEQRNFDINPKKYKSSIDACKYCDYSEICYKTKESYINIKPFDVRKGMLVEEGDNDEI